MRHGYDAYEMTDLDAGGLLRGVARVRRVAERAHRDSCPICDSAATAIGAKVGATSGPRVRRRALQRVPVRVVTNPWIEFDRIYSDAYDAGAGADPLVGYSGEIEHPDNTIRRYEWRGLLERVASLTHVGADTAWRTTGAAPAGSSSTCAGAASVRSVLSRAPACGA